MSVTKTHRQCRLDFGQAVDRRAVLGNVSSAVTQHEPQTRLPFDHQRLDGDALQLGLAPVEDLAYPLGAAILLPALWVWLRDKEIRR